MSSRSFVLEKINCLSKKQSWFGTVIMFLTILLVFSFLVLETYSWGKYVFFGLIVACFLLYFVRTKGKFVVSLNCFFVYSIIFAIYCGASSLWAINSSFAIEKAVTLFEIIVCYYVLFLCYREIDNIGFIIQGIKWAGFVLCIYTIYYYGLSTLLTSSLQEELRIQNSFSNINSISLLVALSCLIEFWDFIYKRHRVQVLFYIPSIIVMFASQSRKAFAFLILGFVFLYILKVLKSKNFFLGIFKLAAFAMLFIFIVFALSKLQISSGVSERFSYLLNMLFNSGEVDHSALVREELIVAGFNSWKTSPFTGIGIGCSRYIAMNAVGKDYYLHNNYIELLSGGGLIGLALYYWFYVYLFFSFIKYRNNNYQLFIILICWTFLILVLDYGMVTYYAKEQWIYLLVLFLGKTELKRGKLNGNFQQN